jgi:hypothetical protein
MAGLISDPLSISKVIPFAFSISLAVSTNLIDESPPKFNGKSLAVVIAVPVCVVVVAIFFLFVCYCTRKHRSIPEGLVVPRNGRFAKKKGYGESRSRRTRAGVEKTNDEFEMGAVGGVYHDDPSSMYTDHPGQSVYTDHPERTEGDSLEH